MDWYGRQNNRVDELAKEYVKECIYNNKRANKPIQLWYEPFSLWIDGVKQSKICKKKLYERLQQEKYLQILGDLSQLFNSKPS